ncbi:ABC transporter ATP-binding protein, partial [Legionella sp. 29fVS95]
DSHAILEQLKQFNLIDKIAGLPDGLQTKIYEWQTVFTQLELTKLMIVRAIITKSRLIVLDRVLDPFNGHELDSVLSLILSLEETLLLITTQRPHFNELSNYLVLPS